MKFVPLFLVVLIVYNIVIFTKPEWLLEPELFDAKSHVLTQDSIPVDVTPPEPTVAPADGAEVVEGEPVEAETVAPEELAPGYVDKSAKPIASIALPSGVNWKPIAADVLLLFAVLVLYIELYKTTRIGSAAKWEHFLSFLVFLIFVAEFLLIPQCATSVFCIVMLLSLIDVFGGIAISSMMRKRAKEA